MLGHCWSRTTQVAASQCRAARCVSDRWQLPLPAVTGDSRDDTPSTRNTSTNYPTDWHWRDASAPLCRVHTSLDWSNPVCRLYIRGRWRSGQDRNLCAIGWNLIYRLSKTGNWDGGILMFELSSFQSRTRCAWNFCSRYRVVTCRVVALLSAGSKATPLQPLTYVTGTVTTLSQKGFFMTFPLPKKWKSWPIGTTYFSKERIHDLWMHTRISSDSSSCLY